MLLTEMKKQAFDGGRRQGNRRLRLWLQQQIPDQLFTSGASGFQPPPSAAHVPGARPLERLLVISVAAVIWRARRRGGINKTKKQPRPLTSSSSFPPGINEVTQDILALPSRDRHFFYSRSQKERKPSLSEASLTRGGSSGGGGS